MSAVRYLYLVRHAEATSDETGLTDAGRRQARLLGERLRDTPVSAVQHGPLARAVQTAELIAAQLPGVRRECVEAAGDFLPYRPGESELPPDAAPRLLAFLAGYDAAEEESGAALAAEAVRRFTGPVPGEQDRHELVVTHNFLVGYLVRDALGAPPWRWLTLNHANAALTVIRYAPARPPSLLVYNDTRHLPADLRWTGFPSDLHV